MSHPAAGMSHEARGTLQGGIGPLGLATEDLHVLDLSSATARWHRVVVPNNGPGPRYAHVLALVAQRYLVTVGGNDGRQVAHPPPPCVPARKPVPRHHLLATVA
jgi:protein phosphatase